MTHRNFNWNEDPHHLYEIVDKMNDDVFKYGISSDPIGKDGMSDRMRKQVHLLNRVDEWLRFFARILIRDIPGKQAARILEGEHIRQYEKLHGHKPRGNLRY